MEGLNGQGRRKWRFPENISGTPKSELYETTSPPPNAYERDSEAGIRIEKP
jgi:hypothetical protein